MSVRRRATPARIGAGVMLAAACVMGPVAANAAPVGGIAPLQGGICSTPSLALSSTEVQVGEPVTITGTCFGENAPVELRISGGTQQTFKLKSDSGGTVSDTWTPSKPGKYTIQLVSAVDPSINAAGDVIVAGPPGEGTPGEEPTPPGETTDPEEPTEPEEPKPEEPTEPEKPTEPEEPTEPEKPTEPEEPTEPVKPTEPGEGTDTGGGDNDGSDNGSNPAPGTTAPGSPGTRSPGESSPSAPTKTFPGSNAPAPSAGGQQQRPQSPAAELPAAPETGTRDFSGSGSKQPTAQQRMGSLTMSVGQAFAGMFGSSTEAPDGSDPAASDGGGELAKTGAEITAAAAFTALALAAGAGMLWLQRRRSEG